MSFSARRLAPVALLLAATASGCNVFPRWGLNDYEGPRRYSEEWYEMKGDGPVGARQCYKKGRLWPPYPRPTGEQLSWCQRYHAAHYWPWPYNCQDRAYVREVSDRQVHNGWVCETTLLDYHFDDKHALNQPGQLHLKWILENVPPQHRTAFVQKTSNEEVNQQRLASVQQVATEMVGSENVPKIELRVASPTGRPALEIDSIRRKEIAAIRIPQITYTSPSAGGSSSGASSGQ
jgi:hypothetical protein